MQRSVRSYVLLLKFPGAKRALALAPPGDKTELVPPETAAYLLPVKTVCGIFSNSGERFYALWPLPIR